MTDIVERLRKTRKTPNCDPYGNPFPSLQRDMLCEEAADECERLRTGLEQYKALVESVRSRIISAHVVSRDKAVSHHLEKALALTLTLTDIEQEG